MESSNRRRDFLRASAVVGAGLILNGCRGGSQTSSPQQTRKEPANENENQMGGEVTATEDLMREHGVLRRALLVYSAAAVKLRGDVGRVFAGESLAPDALQKTAKLFRA